MGSQTFLIHDDEQCDICDTSEDVVCNDGDWICTDCLFEQQCKAGFDDNDD